jgi:hypothetical protein
MRDREIEDLTLPSLPTFSFSFFLLNLNPISVNKTLAMVSNRGRKKKKGHVLSHYLTLPYKHIVIGIRILKIVIQSKFSFLTAKQVLKDPNFLLVFTGSYQ